MADPYPDYNVLAKRGTPSWNRQTRSVIDARLALDVRTDVFGRHQLATLYALVERVVPQPRGRPPINIVAMLLDKIAQGDEDGYRHHALPPIGEAWQLGIDAIATEAHMKLDRPFTTLKGDEADQLLQHIARGKSLQRRGAGFLQKFSGPGDCCRISYRPTMPTRRRGARWASGARPAPVAMFGSRLIGVIRGRRWSVVANVDDPERTPRARHGRAPDVFTPGGWVPMREYGEAEEVDFAIVGTGAGGGTLAYRLAEKGFSVVAFDAGPYWRPLEDFASDERHQSKLYWRDKRVVGGDNPLKLGANNSGKSVGGSTVHFAMVSLRFRPEWFKSRSVLGYGVDWPIGWREMWRYYSEVEQALKISGPVRYPWGPKRPRYPYRAHPLNAAAEYLARGAEALGVPWSETPIATLSALRGKAHPCVYRGMCVIGCSTNAKQSVLVTWLPRALAAGAEIRDLSMVGKIEMGPYGKAIGVHYHREGEWRFQRAKHVVVAGYAIETPRLLLNSASAEHPQGLANSSGLVGKNLMVQLNQAVWGQVPEQVRSYKGPPSLAISEHWNYADEGKDYHGGWAYMSQGPLPVVWAQTLSGGRGLWGQALIDEMNRANHSVGLKMVGEVLPNEANCVTVADETDQYGLPIPRVTFAYGENERAMIAHALNFMDSSLDAVGARERWRETEDTCHLNGTARMGSDPDSSVVNADCRSWDVPNLWVCDGSVFPTVGGVNPSLTIQAIACRTADRIGELAARGEL